MITRLWVTLPLLLLGACAPAAAPAPAPSSVAVGTAAPASVFAFIDDPQAILADLPPALATADVDAPAAPADPAARAAWDAPVARWRDAAAAAARLDGLDPAQAAAEAAAFERALADGLALAALARAQGHAVSDDAVLAAMAWPLIAQAHPLRADPARADAEAAAWAGLWRGDATAPAVITGRHLGAAAAQAARAAWDAARAPAALLGDGGS